MPSCGTLMTARSRRGSARRHGSARRSSTTGPTRRTSLRHCGSASPDPTVSMAVDHRGASGRPPAGGRAMTSFSLAFIADAVHCRGGQERAAAEVLSRISRRISVTVIAKECDLGDAPVRWIPVRAPRRPSVVRTWAFARGARRAERRAACTISNSIGAAALDADVITAQFCHAAFTARFGGIRGGSGLRAEYQRFAQSRFTAVERRAYSSPRLKRVIAVSDGTARELQEFYRVPRELIAVVPNGVDGAVFRPAADPAARRALRERLSLPVGEVIALFVGGDWERKGGCDASAAIAGLAGTRLVILGTGDVGAMRAHAIQLGAGRQVVFPGASLAPPDWYAAG